MKGRGVLAGIALCACTAFAHADQIKVLTAGAFKPVVMALAPGFEQRSGHRLQVENDTAGALARRIVAGEAFDLVVLTEPALKALARDGKVQPAHPVPLARVGIGVAVAQGAPAPDIGSVESFQRALLAARSVAYVDPATGGSSGIYLTQLFERLGVAEQVKAKSVLVPGGLVAQRVVSGEAALAIHQISEILAVPGARLVGPLPAPIQSYTVYAGALGMASHSRDAAQAFLDLLAGEQARAVLKDKGLESP
jgi:molybdate transport system substrate-binding protein